MNPRIALTVWSIVLGAACATSPQAGPPTDFVATGSFEYRGIGASFNDERIVGSKINVSRRADGSWGGVVKQKALDVNVTAGQIKGVNTSVSWTDGPNGVVVDGLFFGHLMHFEVNANQFVAQPGGRMGGFTAGRIDRENFVGGLALRGAAADPHPPEPQFALALLAAFR
jgi:hypothetical protein